MAESLCERSLEERLANPDAWHRPAAYWFWHRRPDPAEIRRQVGELKSAGIHTFQIQARMAYPMAEYLDDEYLAACRVAVDEAARLGMMVGIYDDYNWQTGHAGGRAVSGHDHLRERHLFWTSGCLRSGRVTVAVDDIGSSTESLGAAGMAWHYEGGVSRWGDWEVAFAVAGTGTEAIDVTAAARLTDDRADGCRVEVRCPLADGVPVTVFVSARNTTSRLINVVDPRAVARFIEAGYEPFHAALEDHFGTTVTYFFFDQPHANLYQWAQHRGDLGNSMPFCSDLAHEIRQRWPGRHAQVMLALLEADGLDARALRAQFYAYFSRKAIDVFLGALHRWTRERGVLLSGHEVLGHVGSWDLDGAFNDWDLRVNFGLDHFGVDAQRDLTGVDAQDLNPQLSAKLGDSVARAHGRSGVILEQYFAQAHAGTGQYAGHWGLTLAELRSQTLRHHILGMRQLLFHGYYQTDGFDDDPRMFVNPRFDFPPGENFEPWFADHHADFAMESGQVSEFLEGALPACDAAMLYPLRTIWTDGQSGEHATEVGAWAEYFATRGYGFHLIDESALADADIGDGQIRWGDRSYPTLVLPAVTTLRSSATTAVLARAAASGVAVVASGAVPTTYQEGPQTAAADFRALLAAGARRITTAGDGDAVAGLHLPCGRDSLLSASGPVWSWSGRVDNEHRMVVFNDGPATIVVDLRVPMGTPVARLIDGRFTDVEHRIDLEPEELALLCVGRVGAPPRHRPPSTPHPVAVADGWRLRLEGSSATVPIDPGIGWEKQGFPAYSGRATYCAHVELSRRGDLVIELPDVAGCVTIAVNGHVIGRRGWGPYRLVAEARRTVPGRNSLEITVAPAAANRYYAGTGFRDEPEATGLLADPIFTLLLPGEGTSDAQGD
ncbi:MAG: hypothetical protein ACK5LS_07990 [Propioniciclava sp.]